MHDLSIWQNASLLIARIMFVAVFVFQDAIYNKIIYAKRSVQYMRGFGLPLPYLLLILTVVFEIIAGLMIISGWNAPLGALIILGFTFFATLIFHRFWTYANPVEFQNQLNHFMKNISIMGGAIFIIVFNVGQFTV